VKKVAVVLSGCGVFDGAEIHEAVLAILSLDRRDAHVEILAPDIKQMHVINHATGETMAETRNVLVESARIARGKIGDLADADVGDYDACIFPGGYGAAKNLCDYAVKQVHCDVDPVVESFILAALQARRVLGFICIAPALLARVAGKAGLGPKVTIGTDPKTAGHIEAFGGEHIECQVDGVVVDERNRLVTTPAYMLGQRISDVARGIDKLVETVLEMCES